MSDTTEILENGSNMQPEKDCSKNKVAEDKIPKEVKFDFSGIEDIEANFIKQRKKLLLYVSVILFTTIVVLSVLILKNVRVSDGERADIETTEVNEEETVIEEQSEKENELEKTEVIEQTTTEETQEQEAFDREYINNVYEKFKSQNYFEWADETVSKSSLSFKTVQLGKSGYPVLIVNNINAFHYQGYVKAYTAQNGQAVPVCDARDDVDMVPNTDVIKFSGGGMGIWTDVYYYIDCTTGNSTEIASVTTELDEATGKVFISWATIKGNKVSEEKVRQELKQYGINL